MRYNTLEFLAGPLARPEFFVKAYRMYRTKHYMLPRLKALVVALVCTGCGDPQILNTSSDQDNRNEVAMSGDAATLTPPRAAPAQIKSEGSLPIYEIVDRKTHDVPAKTQIELHAVLSGMLDEPRLRQLLYKLYDDANATRGFQHRSGKPTHVFIYLYTSRDHFDSHFGQWIAMLSKAGEQSRIDIHIKRWIAEHLDSDSEVKHGLSEAKRKVIFREIVAAEDHAHADVERMYPLPEMHELPRHSQSELRQQFDKQVEALGPLMDKYKSEVAERYGLTQDELSDISAEAVIANWPLPPAVAKPFDLLSPTFEISDGDTKSTKYTWTLKLQSNVDHKLEGSVTIKWLDSNGSVLKKESPQGLDLRAKELKSLSGATIISMPQAELVHSMAADVNLR